MKTINAEYIDLGIASYPEVFKLQEKLAEKRAKDEIPDTILISEHYPIVNFGMRGIHNTFSESLKQELEEEGFNFTEDNAIEYLKDKGIEFCRTSRGGGATFIGPGQINIYPVVKYEKIVQSIMGVNEYKKIIDSVMYSVLKDYGLEVNVHTDSRNDDPEAKKSNRKDIWIQRGEKSFKLGGKGIHTSRGVAYHGFNFYLKQGSTQGFQYVNPCGYSKNELGTLSMEEALGKEIPEYEFKKRILDKIKKSFRYESLKEGKI